MPHNKTTVGENLRILRNRLGLTQEQLGKEFNISGKAIAAYESTVNEPNIKMIINYSEKFNVPIDDILTTKLT